MYGWGSEEKLVSLSAEDVSPVLERFVSGKISEGDIEAWANALECREDVDFSSKNVFLAIHFLANPDLEGKLTNEAAKKLLGAL